MVENIGVGHNFFHIGGNSLKAMSLQARIFKELGVQVLISDLFKYPTIREFSKILGVIEKPSPTCDKTNSRQRFL